MTDTTVAHNVIGALRDMGVQHVFGVPSGGWVDCPSSEHSAQIAA